MAGIVRLIEKKREGAELTRAEIERAVRGYNHGSVPDYQMAALLMAVCWRGLSRSETVHLTRALVESGERWELPPELHPALDKHSTGGVGDKATLMLAPMVAAAGGRMLKMSGRGLAHTGGTIDKLESIPGFRAALTRDEALAQLRRVGCVVMSQSEGLVSAEKKLYALRDATGTVPQRGLIVSSILSKKIAAGATHIVIDVKHGGGAFFATEQEARAFAAELIAVAAEFGPQVTAALSPMDEPLGRAVGNALEVQEVWELLRARDTDSEVTALCARLGGKLLALAGLAQSEDAGAERLREVVRSGAAEAKFGEFIAAQGGDLGAFAEEMERLGERTQRVVVKAQADGTVSRVDALAVGKLCHRLGAGRTRKEDEVNPWVGVVLWVKRGDAVRRGDALAEAYAPAEWDEAQLEWAASEMLGAVAL